MSAVDARFRHVALVHAGDEELVEWLVPTVDAAVDRGEAVLVCLGADAAGALADRLERPDGVTFVAGGERYQRPGVAMAMLHRFLSEALGAGAPAVWSIGTVPYDGTARDHGWTRYEAAVDEVLGHLPLKAVCTHDTVTLTPAQLDTACHCHAHVEHAVAPPAGGSSAHPAGVWGAHPAGGWGAAPRARSAGPTATASPAPHGAPDVFLEVTASAQVRRRLSAAYGDVLSPDRLAELHLVATELATNGLRHGRAPVTLATWLDDDRVVVEVADAGPGIDDPYPDLRPLHGGAHGGYGLWLVGQLADQVEVERLGERTSVTAVVPAVGEVAASGASAGVADADGVDGRDDPLIA